MLQVIIIVLRALFVLSIVSVATPALAANYVVNDVGSNGDSNLADGICDAVGAQTCTLRAAIEQGNARSGPHTITFAASVTAITITVGLPTITAPVTIDGLNANAVGQRVDINGNNLGGFDFSETSTSVNAHGARGSTIKNLVIRNFNDDGISLSGHGYTVTNCYIGVMPDGETASHNSDDGISISGVIPRLPSIPNLPGNFNFDPAQIAAQLVMLFSSIPPTSSMII